jgi:hypothetical protein
MEGCQKTDCPNHNKPVNVFPAGYWKHGKTAAGKPRMRCRHCGSTVVAGHRHLTMRRRAVNKHIVLDLVNRASLNGIMRKHRIGPKTLYERIDFIHEQMSAFEAAKLRSLRENPRFAGRRFALCTDGQDHMVNWLSRDRRIAVHLTCLSTADNLTGFVFRSDLNFDPMIGDIVEDFERMLKSGEFEDPERLGLIGRYVLPAYFNALRFELERRIRAKENDPKEKGDLLALGRLQEELDRIDPPSTATDEDELASDNPISGAVISRTYTALAHYMLIDEMMPALADIHHSTDTDGAVTMALFDGDAEAIYRRQSGHGRGGLREGAFEP